MGLVRRTGDELQRIVVESLAQGNELSQRVLGLVDLQAGESITYVPASTGELSWERGGVLSRQHEGSEHLHRLLTEVSSASFSIAVGENPVVKAGDQGLLSGIPNAIAVAGDDVYEWTASEQDLFEFVSGLSNPWPGAHCFLVGEIEGLPTDIGRAAMDEIAKNVVGIVVEAFDTEGFVLWKRAQ